MTTCFLLILLACICLNLIMYASGTGKDIINLGDRLAIRSFMDENTNNIIYHIYFKRSFLWWRKYTIHDWLGHSYCPSYDSEEAARNEIKNIRDRLKKENKAKLANKNSKFIEV